MSPDKKSALSTNESTPADKSISIGGDVVDSTVIVGDNNTVNKTIIQKFFNIFKSDSESMEQRNRRILLGHVENAWIKGVLDASLHGAALLDLGIKQDPEAVTKYPWAIKKESTDETLPAGISMLEIFDNIGMGRSLLILGAPGSGKTTMLLELALQLIARAREDFTYPIPMVFNLASWTEKLSLADWLAQELNNLYSVPRKTTPDWVKGDKLLLLLDGLDEVRQESRAKCVEAINAFRKEHGLTSLAVCSRSQDYADLNAKLSFEGAIEVQPLTQKQITEFFNRFGKEMAGIKQVLKKDTALREMAETPLFLSIMIMAYRDKQDVDILVSKDENAQRKHLFDTYVERMFERPPRSKNERFKKQDVLQWLKWLAQRMFQYNQTEFYLERMQPDWLSPPPWGHIYTDAIGALYGFLLGMGSAGFITLLRTQAVPGKFKGMLDWPITGLICDKTGWPILICGITAWLVTFLTLGPILGLFLGLLGIQFMRINPEAGMERIETVEIIHWSWLKAKSKLIKELIYDLALIMIMALALGLLFGWASWSTDGLHTGLTNGLKTMAWTILTFGPLMGLYALLGSGLTLNELEATTRPNQRIWLSAQNAIWTGLASGLVVALIAGLAGWRVMGLQGVLAGPIFGLVASVLVSLYSGGSSCINHVVLRIVLFRNGSISWQLVPFLDHCVDLIFLRRIGGGYIFVHRLLMEHFAEMKYTKPLKVGWIVRFRSPDVDFEEALKAGSDHMMEYFSEVIGGLPVELAEELQESGFFSAIRERTGINVDIGSWEMIPATDLTHVIEVIDDIHPRTTGLSHLLDDLREMAQSAKDTDCPIGFMLSN